MQLRGEAWKIQDFNGVWTRDLAIPVRRSNQLSYEATDVGSWSFVGSNGPVRNESMMKWYMKWIIHELRIWNQVRLWSSQLWAQFMQLRGEAWTGFEPVTSRFRCDALTNWAMKPLTLGAGHLWVLMVPWGMNQWWNGIWNESYMNCGYEIKWGYDLRIRTHKWPAPNVSGFIAQLVRASHRNREVTGSNPVEVLNFSGFSTQLHKLRS